MKEKSDGSTAKYYELPVGATELQHLISHRNMNAQIGEIFRACYRYGQASHSDQLRDAKKMLFYAQAEVERLEMEAGKLVRVSGVPYPVTLDRKQEKDQVRETPFMDAIHKRRDEVQEQQGIADRYQQALLDNIRRLRDRGDLPRAQEDDRFCDDEWVPVK